MRQNTAHCIAEKKSKGMATGGQALAPLPQQKAYPAMAPVPILGVV
jgi:hypothetical protein